MGADLYIQSIHRPLVDKYGPLFQAAVYRRDHAPDGSKERDKAQRAVERYYDRMYSAGYFRDSYNGTNILCTLGLSWWQDVKPLCRDRELEGENLRKFRDMVANAEQHLPTRKELTARLATVADTGANSLAAWHEWFTGKRKHLLAFLDTAIERNCGIHCSL